VNPLVFKMVEKLWNSADELRRVVWDLEEATIGITEAPMPNAILNNAKLAQESATALKASAAGLLATAERVERLAALKHSPGTTNNFGRNETPGAFRESAANVLAAAFVKAKGGSIGESSDWEPALRAAAIAVDALGDYVMARIIYELRSGCSESGIFAVAPRVTKATDSFANQPDE
jgi:hypothetical protein